MQHTKKIAIAGFAASMLIGAGTGLVLNIPGGASATAVATTPDDGSDATTDTTTATTATTATTDPTEADESTDNPDGPPAHLGMVGGWALDELVTAGTITEEQAEAIVAAVRAEIDAAKAEADTEDGAGRPDRGAAVGAALADLVAAGTITQEQSDAVTTALADRRGQGPGHGPGMGHGRGGFGRGQFAEAAATALGITVDELRTELESGATIAEVATARGIDVQTVIDAIVADRTADLTERVTDIVNGVMPTD